MTIYKYVVITRTHTNKKIKHTPNQLWNPDSFYSNLQNKTRELPLSLATSLKPQDMRIRARENIKEKAKEQIEREQVEELNKGGLIFFQYIRK